MRLVSLILALMYLSASENVFASDIFYPLSDIPAELLENANSVVRKSEIKLELFSETKIRYTVKDVLTVMNKNGEGEGILYIPYDSNSTITIESANVYDKNGALIKKFKKNEIYDQASFDGFSLYTDARFKRITPQISSYPYTVDYEYTIDYKGAIDFYNWTPCDSYNKSVESASYQILVYSDQGVRIKSNKLIKPLKDGELIDGIETYLWEVQNMKALEREPLSVSLYNFVPRVMVSPESFSFYDSEGSMASWKDFGNWSYSLIEDKAVLSEERVKYLNELTADVDDPKEKVKLVYEFLQGKTRYVSVQLGIGGFEPVSAQKTDEVGYGDCKALSNYMKAMLQSIDIKSYYTLVQAGNGAGNIDPDFPSQSFNHVILTVPVNNDTLFLECTSKFSPFGFLGSFTDDRYALLVDKDKSHLIRTTKYGSENNTWYSKAVVDLNESGYGEINDTVVFNGLQYEYIEDELRKTHEKQIEYEYETSEIPGARYTKIEYLNSPGQIPSATRIRTIEVDRLATTMGDRMFVPVNRLNRRTSVPKKTKDRKYPFRLGISFQDTDTIRFIIPDGYKVEYLPEPVDIEAEFGRYTSTLDAGQNLITFYRHEEKNKGTYPPEKYDDYIQFVRKIVDADNQQLILKKL